MSNIDVVFTNCGVSPAMSYSLCELPPTINSGQIKFFHNFLCDRHFHLPHEAKFAVVITPVNLEYLTSEMKKISTYFLNTWNATGKKWQFDNADAISFDQEKYHKTIGCVFATDCALPEETNAITQTGMAGFMKSPTFDQREPFNNLEIGFFETSTSFVDLILRPWSIAAGRHGLAPRLGERSIKANITVYQMDLTEECQPQRIRKIWNFYECVPVTIGRDELRKDSPIVNYRQAQFTYMDYDITDTPIAVEDLQRQTNTPSPQFDLNAAQGIGNIGTTNNLPENLPRNSALT